MLLCYFKEQYVQLYAPLKVFNLSELKNVNLLWSSYTLQLLHKLRFCVLSKADTTYFFAGFGPGVW